MQEATHQVWLLNVLVAPSMCCSTLGALVFHFGRSCAALGAVLAIGVAREIPDLHLHFSYFWQLLGKQMLAKGAPGCPNTGKVNPKVFPESAQKWCWSFALRLVAKPCNWSTAK